MLVLTRWPGLVEAIKRAGHEPVLVYPLEENIVPQPIQVCEGLVLTLESLPPLPDEDTSA